MKGESSLKLHERVALLWKKTAQNGKYIDLEAGLLVYTLLRPLLPPPGQSYMDKTSIALNKNIPFTLVANSKTLKM